MGPGTIEVDLDVFLQHATQLSLFEYDHRVEVLPAHRTEEAFADGIQIGRARRYLHNLDLSALGYGSKPLAELLVVVLNQVPRPSVVRCSLRRLLGASSVSGTAG